MVCGEGLNELNDIVARLHSKDYAASLGLRVQDLGTKNSMRVPRDDPAVVQGNEVAAVCGRLGVSLLLRRQRALAELSIYPVAFLELLSPGADTHKVLERVKWNYKMHQHCVTQASREKFFEKVAARSPFQQMKVRQYVAILEAHDWQMNDQLRHLLQKDWQGLAQTKVVEDGFACGRMAELSRNSREVPFEATAIPRGAGGGYEFLFQPPPGSTPKQFRSVVSTAKKAPP